MSRTVDKMRWCRLLWGTLIIPEFQWRSLPDAFRQMHAAVIVTDCKSLFHLVSRRAMPSFEEYRTTLEVLLKKERCMEHCFFRWIPTSLQLADPLTKNMDHRFFEQYWNKGHFNYLMRQQVFKRMHTGNQLYKGWRNHIKNRVLGVRFPLHLCLWCDVPFSWQHVAMLPCATLVPSVAQAIQGG